MTEKICTKCGELKPLSAFGKCARYEDGKQRHCKACAALDRAKLKKAKQAKNTDGHIYAIINSHVREYDNPIQAATRNLLDFDCFMKKHNAAKESGAMRFICESVLFFLYRPERQVVKIIAEQGPLLKRPQVMGLGVLWR
jgi:hypothetical protein